MKEPAPKTRRKNRKKYQSSKDIRAFILGRDRSRCVYCGKGLQVETMTLDHFVPIRNGGTNYVKNLVTACSTCNRRKSHEPIELFYDNFCRNAGARILRMIIHASEANGDIVPDAEVIVDWCVPRGIPAGRLTVLEVMRRLEVQPGELFRYYKDTFKLLVEKVRPL